MGHPDIVYVVRPGEHNPQLRYSLRSLANLPHRQVWVAGHCPAWVRDVGAIPVPGQPTKYLSSTANLRAAAEHPDVAEDFLLFNDDFFVMQPIGVMPVLHRGPVNQVEGYYAARAQGKYLRGLRETRALLADLGVPAPLSYELHVPMPMTKTRALETLDTGQHLDVLHKRTLYGGLYSLGGRHITDPKILTRGNHFSRAAPFLSTMPDTFNYGQVGAFIRARFPTPSPYEKRAGRSR
ncbi:MULTISPECIES: hypothetical protein [Streptomyces]|uniref:Uncharacterized protein n=1 Tax=Streptomyces flavovirens TaxID=52258 RepID=A0ABV8NBT6_9ACTN|nr:hypothetical protein [Streptomyces sp. MBT51]MBK3592438.1 hypothetical protein [Streptomyces sp. MBT51]